MMISKLHLAIGLLLSGGCYFGSTTTTFSTDNKNDYKPNTGLQEKTPSQKSIANGKEVYADFCMQCHQANGKGDGVNFPTLDGSTWLTEKRTQSIHALKFGLSGPIVVNGKKFNSAMPPMGLSNQEVTDVMNYIMNSWGNKQKKSVSLQEVALVKQ